MGPWEEVNVFYTRMDIYIFEVQNNKPKDVHALITRTCKCYWYLKLGSCNYKVLYVIKVYTDTGDSSYLETEDYPGLSEWARSNYMSS